MSTSDNGYIDFIEPGCIAFAARSMGGMAFGIVTASLDCTFDKAEGDVSFHFNGFDDRDQVTGSRLGRDVRT